MTRHKIPTHLQVTDKVLQLPLFGIGITARQFLLLLIGGAASYQVWLGLVAWSTLLPPWGEVLHWGVTLLVAASTLMLTFVQVAGLPLEQWLLLLLLYWRRPRVCLWRSVRGELTAREGLLMPAPHTPADLKEML